MSEFTASILFKSADKKQITGHLLEAPCRYKTLNLNERWQAFYLEDAFLQQESTRKFLLGITGIPLLYFLHAADHGWGYSIYFNKKIICNALLDYGLEYSMAKKIIKKRFPLVKEILNVAQEEWRSACEEVRQSSEYCQALVESLSSSHPEYFKLFDLEDKTILELKSILNASWLTERENLCRAMDKFRDTLGIREMEWGCYQYLDQECLCKTS